MPPKSHRLGFALMAAALLFTSTPPPPTPRMGGCGGDGA